MAEKDDKGNTPSNLIAGLASKHARERWWRGGIELETNNHSVHTMIKKQMFWKQIQEFL